MANEIIGRVHNVGLGKESTAGTAVSATDWLPKTEGVLMAHFEVAEDPSSHGVIDGVKQVSTTKTWTEVEMEGILQDNMFGHLLLAAFGLEYSCVRFPVSGGSGTFTEGETVTESTSSATGVLRRTDQSAGTPVLYIAPATGTFTGGQTLTGGTSGATKTGGTIESPSAVRSHIFRRANTNTHQSYTLYGKDLVSDDRAAYCILDMLEINAAVGDFTKFKAKWMGKVLSSTSSTATYSSQYPFVVKSATFKTAADHNSLDAASAVSIERLRLTIEKNVEPYYAFGSASPSTLHNRQFIVRGDFDMLYNEITTRDLLTNSSNKALRLTVTNATTIGSATNPTIQFDIPVAGFSDWGRSPGNDDLMRQTIGFVATYDLTRALSIEAFLTNTKTAAY